MAYTRAHPMSADSYCTRIAVSTQIRDVIFRLWFMPLILVMWDFFAGHAPWWGLLGWSTLIVIVVSICLVNYEHHVDHQWHQSLGMLKLVDGPFNFDPGHPLHDNGPYVYVRYDHDDDDMWTLVRYQDYKAHQRVIQEGEQKVPMVRRSIHKGSPFQEGAFVA